MTNGYFFKKEICSLLVLSISTSIIITTPHKIHNMIGQLLPKPATNSNYFGVLANWRP
nr:MAG TPA: hypothetical protein [Inoviridae sp.]